MNKSLLITLVLIGYMPYLVFAEDSTVQRKRLHSVQKAVDSVGKVETKKVSVVENFKHMFQDGKVSGRFRVAYGSYNYKERAVDDTYATAIGGILKYELAEYNGFNVGVAMYASHDIGALTGKDQKLNSDFSSSKGSYSEVGEAYINYKYKDLNLRVGRQVLDTPLADSDDLRIIQNSFNAAVATYMYDGFTLMAGNIQSWQGFDAGLDDEWVNIGDHGVNFGGITYGDMWEFNIWYYNITNNTNAFYVDGGLEYPINDDMLLHVMLQYLNESELDNSGYAADIYGASIEFVINGLGLNFGYNKSDRKKDKHSFSGMGGGALFTNMDTMILDEITQDRESDAYVAGISYEYGNLNFLYAYGDFNAKSNAQSDKAEIVEQDISFEYKVNDEFLIAAIYVLSEDKASATKTGYDFNRAQVLMNYNF